MSEGLLLLWWCPPLFAESALPWWYNCFLPHLRTWTDRWLEHSLWRLKPLIPLCMTQSPLSTAGSEIASACGVTVQSTAHQTLPWPDSRTLLLWIAQGEQSQFSLSPSLLPGLLGRSGHLKTLLRCVVKPDEWDWERSRLYKWLSL